MRDLTFSGVMPANLLPFRADLTIDNATFRWTGTAGQPGLFDIRPNAAVTVQNNGLVTSGATLTEIIPANTTYVAGSTTLNGVAVADVSGAMPFITARAINSPSAASGVINPGSTAAERAVVVFRVTIN